MKRAKIRLSNFKTSLSVGLFLAVRQMRRSSKATTALIIIVMTLTFLNLVVIRGILVGLLEGSTDGYRSNYAGDILVTNLPKKSYIENSATIIESLKSMPWVEKVTYRYIEASSVEANYKERIRLTDEPNAAGTLIVGIDPDKENEVTGISRKIIEGRFLTHEDSDGILLGANLLRKYLDFEGQGITLLENVEVGDRVRVVLGNSKKELTVVGVLKSKVDQVDFRVFTLDSTLRNLIGRSDFNVDEVVAVLKPGVDPRVVKEALLTTGFGNYAKIQTWEESLPKFLLDIKNTFGLLGNVVGSIGLIAASITIFIIIFINAITRRKFIGILKGIGIDALSIEFSYVLQSIFYAIIGIVIGLVLLYGFLVPFIDAHPIKFPFSDGILVAEIPNTLARGFLLIVATLIAGYIPARIVVKQNTLDAILGRK